MDDVPIIDDVAMLAIDSGPAARQSEEMRGALEDIEPIVIEAHEQLVTDQPRRPV